MPFSLKLTTTKNCTRHKILKEMTHRKINEMGAKKNKKQTPYYPCLLLDHDHVANPALDYSVILSILL